MIDIDSFLNGLELLFEWQNFLLMILGMGLGIIFGSIPGLTGSLGIAMMLPLTFAMDPLPAFVFLLSIYTGGLFGGAVTAILLNTPGSPAAIATTLDGYSLTKKRASWTGSWSRRWGIIDRWIVRRDNPLVHYSTVGEHCLAIWSDGTIYGGRLRSHYYCGVTRR